MEFTRLCMGYEREIVCIVVLCVYLIIYDFNYNFVFVVYFLTLVFKKTFQILQSGKI